MGLIATEKEGMKKGIDNDKSNSMGKRVLGTRRKVRNG